MNYKNIINMSRIRTIFDNLSSTAPTRNFPITMEDIHSAIIDGNEDLVISMLRSSSVSINQSLDRDPYRNTLLHIAIQLKNIKIIKILIEYGADLRIKNKFGDSACDLLSKSGLGKLLEDLLEFRVVEINKLKIELDKKDKLINDLENSKSNLNNSLTILRDEIITLKKRNIDLEKTCDNLLESTMKKRR